MQYLDLIILFTCYLYVAAVIKVEHLSYSPIFCVVEMAHAETLIQKCKAIACLREKLATDRRKRLHSVKVNGDRAAATDKS